MIAISYCFRKSNKASEVPGGNATAASLCTPLSFNVNNEVQAAIRASAANMEQSVYQLCSEGLVTDIVVSYQ